MPDLTTIVRVDDVVGDDLTSIARIVEENLVKAISDEGAGAVKAYFVSADAASSSLRIGLRFEGMDPAEIEGTASELLELALDASGTDHGHRNHTRRLSTRLVGV